MLLVALWIVGDQVTWKEGTEGQFQDCLGFLPSVNAYYD